MFYSIKSKLLGSVILIVALSFLTMGLVTYWYFSSLLENQVLKDRKVHLSQVVNQLDQLADDIRKYSFNMINDEQLQQFSYRKDYSTVYDEYATFQDAVSKLSKYNVMRDYLESSAIIRSDGKIFWSSFFVDSYYEEQLKDDWFQEAMATNQKSGFTKPHYLQDNSKHKVISYYIRFNPKYGGILLLNINFNAFSDLTESLALSFDEYAWIDDKENFLINQGLDAQHWSQMSDKTNSLIKSNDGYYMNQALKDNRGIILTHTPKTIVDNIIQTVLAYGIAFLVLFLCLCLALFIPIISGITRPIMQMTKAMRNVSRGNYNITLSFNQNSELLVLKNGFEAMLTAIEQQMQEEVAHHAWKRRISAELLFAQINPHFIYNTLNTVIYMARKQKHMEIEDIVESLIGILHDSVQIGEDNLFTTIGQEVELIDNYLRIQNYRYNRLYQLRWEIEEGLDNAIIPKSCIQPLVENAIFHGLSGRDVQGSIDITVSRRLETLEISITDDGCGMTLTRIATIMDPSPSASKRGGFKNIGIRNIKERIGYLYENSGFLEIESVEDQGTTVRLQFPLLIQED